MKALTKIMGKIIRFLQVYQNIVIGGIIIAFSVAMLFASTSIRVDKFSSSPVDNAAFLPRLIFGILIVVGIVMIIQGIQDIKKNKQKLLEGEALEKASKETLRSLGALCILLVYILCFKPVGFMFHHLLHPLFDRHDVLHDQEGGQEAHRVHRHLRGHDPRRLLLL